MKFFLFGLLAVISGSGIYWGFRDPKRFATFPFLFCLAIWIQIIPSAFSFLFKPEIAPDFVYNPAITICLLSCAAGMIGYFCVRPGGVTAQVTDTYDRFYFTVAAVALTLLGTFGYLYLGHISGEGLLGFYSGETALSGLEGEAVYALNLARLTRPALVLATIGFIIYRSRLHLLMLIVCLLFPFLNIVFNARRSDVFFAALAIFIPLSLYTKFRLPRLAMVVGAIVAVAAILILPSYRQFSRIGADKEGWADVELQSVIEDYFAGEKTNEYLESAYDVAAVNETGKYGYGTEMWNTFVRLYVPRGILGAEFKESLFLPSIDLELIRYQQFGDARKNYLNYGGFQGAFLEFGYFGAVIYFFIGAFFASLYRKAQQGFQGARLLYSIVGIVPAFVVYETFYYVFNLFLPYLVICYVVHRVCLKRTPAPNQVPSGFQRTH